MSETNKFSDVSMAYSNNIYNLNEARNIFENECRVLSDKIQTHCDEMKGNAKSLAHKFRWGNINEYKTLKAGAWTSFIQAIHIGMDVRVPECKRFDNNIAHLWFDLSFDHELKRFCFKIRFENKFSRNDQFDETVVQIALKEHFKEARPVKNSTAILATYELNDALFENISSMVANAMLVVQEAIDTLYPDSLYDIAGEVRVIETPLMPEMPELPGEEIKSA